MDEDFEEGAPSFATQRPPSAMAQDGGCSGRDGRRRRFRSKVRDHAAIDPDRMISIRQAVDLALRSEAPRDRRSPGDARSVPQSLPGDGAGSAHEIRRSARSVIHDSHHGG
jgi:hypothetical protein